MTQPEIIDGVIQDPGIDAHAVSLVNPPSAWIDVLQERQRQVTAEGFQHSDDDAYQAGDMAGAAACYAMQGALDSIIGNKSLGDTVRHAIRELWPWASSWWKPTTPRRDLIKAAALILAEIERLDRAEAARAVADERANEADYANEWRNEE